MATRKSAEPALTALLKSYGWEWHKFGDVRYCIYCGKPLPKSELKPDYIIMPVSTYVECKNSNSTGRWAWADDIGPEGARKNQREFLQRNGGWLFIVLGNGRAPKGKGAWMYPWKVWEQQVERILIELRMASIGLKASGKPTDKDYRPSANVVFDDLFRLKWGKGSWTIPKGHPWWRAYMNTLLANLKSCEEQL